MTATPVPGRPGTGPALASRGGAPVRDTWLPVASPWIGEREKQLVLETLESGWITSGKRALELGERVAALGGAKHGLALSSCTAALHLGLVALDVGPGDEVVTSPYTFAASVNVIEHVGAKPVLADVDPETLCVDPAAIERAITPRTRAILTVDYGGHPCDYDAVSAIARDRKLPVVADAAHALGAAWQGRPVGSLATITGFSFYATKNLTTGEGGTVVTDDPGLMERMAVLSLHGMSRDAWKRYSAAGSWFYEVSAPGYKYNLSDVLAAIGIAQLERFPEMQRRRAELAQGYDARLADLPEIRRPRVRPGATHAWHLYAIGLELERLGCDRARFIEELRAENIGTTVNFIPIHLHPHFRDTLGHVPGAFPVAEDAYHRAITLPLFPRMTDRDLDDVCAAVRKIVAHYRR
ncbi:MAG TPA: DegT/DnrJ/EryC1/StrS aminotransferase family protein [Candidatus Eisenbacteria bacterium]|nr:DegT/DnrJ/EryC1/StrS aminotransferase family protein [Candidatus Eisenbacteria bacterium]